MRRLLYLAALSMLVVALTASVALGQSRGPSGADGSFNCADFDDQGQAQEFFNNAGPGDPNGLDADSDGQACESLPTVVDDGTPDGAAIPGQGESTPAAAPEDDVDCADFVSFAGNPSQFQAQQFFDANNPAQDPFNLDADGDGIACEGLEGGAPEDMAADEDMAAPQQPTITPAATDEAGAAQYADDDVAEDEMTALPDTGGFSLGGIAAGLGVALIAGGLLLKRRLN